MSFDEVETHGLVAKDVRMGHDVTLDRFFIQPFPGAPCLAAAIEKSQGSLGPAMTSL
jgi:hypothetical protein